MNKSEPEMKELLRTRCKVEGREAVAEVLEVSPAYVSMLIANDDSERSRPINKAIARSMGYQLVTSVNKIFVKL